MFSKICSFVALVVLLMGCAQEFPQIVQAQGDDRGLSIRPVNDRELPEPYATPSARNGSQVTDRPEGAELNLPAGFSIQEYAPDFAFHRPRFMLLGPGNEILISDSHDDGSVYVLQDRDRDGVAETCHVLVEGMYRPYGIALWQDYVYVAGTKELKRWKYNASFMTTSGEGETVLSWSEFERGHWTRTIVFNSDGTKMFISIGSASNVNAGEDPRRAAVNAYNPDGTGHELYTEGLRNAVGLDFYPGTDQLWVTVQERDALGDDLVPDYFSSIGEGQFFGWPYGYIGPNEDPRREGERPDLVERTRYPDVLLPAHCGALDIEFYTGSMFPEDYRDGAFVACHGSWNRARRVGYRVDFVPFEEGRPTSGPQPFLGGWMTNPDEKGVWGRPVGILQLEDGSLLITDDGAKKVWRVVYGG